MAAHQSNPMSDRPVMDQLREKTGDIKQNLQDMGSTAKQVAQEQFEGMRDTMSSYYSQGRERAMELEHSLEDRIRERPISSICVAAGAGFLLGMFLTRD